jgi:imidazole glycerol-phosphate synthase subunit HisH
MSTIGIINYEIGNLRSVEKAFQAAGAQTKWVRKPEDIEGVSGLVLPGVGAFGDCIKGLHGIGLWDEVKKWVNADKPFFGICVGYQMLFESSEETPGVDGLGLFKGRVVKFTDPKLKVPQIGWNTVAAKKESPLLNNLPNGTFFYFVHSFYPEGVDPTVIALETEYGVKFAAAIGKGNVFGTQFHPEKSQKAGIQLIQNFIALAEKGK